MTTTRRQEAQRAIEEGQRALDALADALDARGYELARCEVRSAQARLDRALDVLDADEREDVEGDD